MQFEVVARIAALEKRLLVLFAEGKLDAYEMRGFADLLQLGGLEHDDPKLFYGTAASVKEGGA